MATEDYDGVLADPVGTPDPLYVGSGQIASITALTVLSIFSLIVNIYLMVGRIWIRSLHNITGFDGLVLNLLLINFFLSLLVYPFDIVAYVIMERVWPFSIRYCYASTAFTSFFPFVGCWSVAAMALQQFFSYISLITSTIVPDNLRRTTPSWCHVITPTLVIWLIGLGVYCPVAHSLWEVETGPNFCALKGENGLLHDSVWYFWVPLGLTSLSLCAMFTLYIITRVALPRSTTSHIEPVVRWTQPSVSAVQSPPRSANLNPLYNYDVPARQPSTLPSPNPPPLYQNLPLAPQPQDALCVDFPVYVNVDRSVQNGEVSATGEKSVEVARVQQAVQESQFDHMRICLVLAASLLVFIGPYATVLLMFHVALDLHIKVWDVAFTWLCCKPLIEPFLIVAVSKKYQQAVRFWKYSR
ncbi:hypothetical protein RvY_03807 [Ramazzottius varieornatus]|uniref:G-protein coupled receptors family 1 profile domain-containing protein n=1 Tax=Ramazzottius varieornatus TaxID=947166 RepID=A0A1D1UPC0_RAMVA|nr:hypothetical protein RvY_03807 [Ramazzottius varieornatus]